MSEFSITFVTCGTVENAEKIAESLVLEKLAACVNILPGVTSVFFWEGKLSKEKEHLLIIKSREAVSEKMSRRIKDMHDYSVPEIISFPIASGNPDYLQWVKDGTS